MTWLWQPIVPTTVAAVVVHDESDAWWAGVNLAGIAVPIAAGLAALTVTAALAQGLYQQTDDLPIFVAPVALDEEPWQVYVPPLLAAQPLYLPDPEEIPAGSLYHVPDEFYWQVYVPPLLAKQSLYLPDPDSFQPHTVLSESDWDVYTPPLGRAQPLYLPDGEDFRFTSPGQTIIPGGIASAEAIGSHTISNVAAQIISPTGIATSEAHGVTVITNVAARAISPTGIVTGEAIGSHTLFKLLQIIGPSSIASAESIGSHILTKLFQIIAPTGLASGEVIGAHTLVGGVGSPWIGGFYLAGEQVDVDGIVGAVFLNDATPVPGTATMIEGFAHTPTGERYICFWPASGIVFYHRGIATRGDGAMCIIVSAPQCYLGGFGATNRGEICVALMSSDAYNWGIGVTTDGRTGVSSL